METTYRQFSDLISSLVTRINELELQLDQEKYGYSELERTKNEIKYENEQLSESFRRLQDETEGYKEDARKFREITLRELTMEIESDSNLMDELRWRIKDRGMIPAIKYLRSMSTLGLKEAKDFCDALVLREQLHVFGRS
jgi:hypothetical protein